MEHSSDSNGESALAAAIRTNDRACIFLEQEDFRSALDEFGAALLMIRGRCAESSMEAKLETPTANEAVNLSTTISTCQHNKSECLNRTGRRASRRPKRRYEIRQEISSRKQPQEGDEEMTPDFIFRVPVRLLPLKLDECSVFSVSAAILYNLGLTQFLRAILENSEQQISQQRLVKALKLFEMVYSLEDIKKAHRDEESIGEHSSASSIGEGNLSFLHLMGLVNNCAQLHKLLNRRVRADRLLQHMLTCLMLVFVDKEEDPGDYEGFFAATSHLVLRNNFVAEAA